MSRTNTAAVAAEGRRCRIERPAGAREPADPADYYVIEPGGERPEYYPPGQVRRGVLGIDDAISRAAWLSDPKGGGQPQVITRHRPDGKPKVVRRYVGGAHLHAVQETGD